jgi:hypothetical protein
VSWQPIETAPKDECVLVALDPECPFSGRDRVACAERVGRYGGTTHDEWKVSGTSEYLVSTPTHWMPLPEPPDVH